MTADRQQTDRQAGSQYDVLSIFLLICTYLYTLKETKVRSDNWICNYSGTSEGEPSEKLSVSRQWTHSMTIM